MTALFRERKLFEELKHLKKFAEFCEHEHYQLDTDAARYAASAFAIIAMGAGSVLEEVADAREAERTGINTITV